MIRQALNALAACVLTFALCALCYPAVVWALAQLAFPRQAAGSLVYSRDRTAIGSELIAQPFRSDRYFHPRPSAVNYRADAAGGSNLGPKNLELHKQLAERAAALGATSSDPVPVDLIMASGSGLDPDISPEAAYFQAPRVAKARGMSEDRLHAIIEPHIDHSGAILGAPARVNVLKLNLALDDEQLSD